MRLGRLEVSGGAMALLALLYYLDDRGAMPWVLLGCLLHEGGHWWAIRALGGRVVRLRLSWAGAELRLSAAHPLPDWGMVWAALAGPGINLGVAWLSALLARRMGGRLYFFAGINLGLALFNLLPVGWLDGGRALESLLSQLGREELGQWVVRFCAWGTAGLFLTAGLVLLWQSGGRNFTLLVAGLWILARARQEKRGESI